MSGGIVNRRLFYHTAAVASVRVAGIALTLAASLALVCPAHQAGSVSDAAPPVTQTEAPPPATSLPQAPPPLLSDRTEDQVAEFLSMAPGGESYGPKPDLRIYTESSFAAGAMLAVMLASVACLFLAAPGAFLFYSAVSGQPHDVEQLGKSLALLALLSLVWTGLLYSLAFSRNAHSYDVQSAEIEVLERETAPGSIFIGDLRYAGLRETTSSWAGGLVRHPLYRMGAAIPHALFITLQTALLLQAVVPMLWLSDPRIRGWAAVPFWLLWAACVYTPLTYWTQGGGWLAECLDAGSTVPVHIAVGFTALGLSCWPPRGQSPEASASNSIALPIGAVLFFAGSLLLMGGRSVVLHPWPTSEILNGLLAGCAGLLLSTAWLLRGDPADWRLAPVGLLAGLIAVLPGSASVSPTSAVVIGGCGAGACLLALSRGPAARWETGWMIFAIHGVSGLLGLLLAGVFATADVAGADVQGNPITGLIYGNVEPLRVQFLTGGLAAVLAVTGGLVLPRVANLIGWLLRLLSAVGAGK